MGEEVEMFYGKRSSGDYLIHNGFVPDHGIQPDFYELRLSRCLPLFLFYPFIQISPKVTHLLRPK